MLREYLALPAEVLRSRTQRARSSEIVATLNGLDHELVSRMVIDRIADATPGKGEITKLGDGDSAIILLRSRNLNSPLKED